MTQFLHTDGRTGGQLSDNHSVFRSEQQFEPSSCGNQGQLLSGFKKKKKKKSQICWSAHFFFKKIKFRFVQWGKATDFMLTSEDEYARRRVSHYRGNMQHLFWRASVSVCPAREHIMVFLFFFTAAADKMLQKLSNISHWSRAYSRCRGMRTTWKRHKAPHAYNWGGP